MEDVDGSSVRVQISDDTSGGLLFVNGEGYRVGQVGGFVRIPAGYAHLFGVISQVGAGAAPGSPELAPQLGNRWLRVELVGEVRGGGGFKRGISQYPSIGDTVHVVTESDLGAIYSPGREGAYVPIGRVASAESIRAFLDLNRLVSRHSAIVGSTGAGKSSAVASLLSTITDSGRMPGARVVLLDIHGEYAGALGDRATVFRVAPGEGVGQERLCIPFWALALDELLPLCMGILNDAQRSAIASQVLDLKKEAFSTAPIAGLSVDDIDVDTPVPFRIRELWLRQHKIEHRTVMKVQGGSDEEITDALVIGANGKPEQPGDAESLVPPRYRNLKQTGPKEDQVSTGPGASGLRKQLAVLRSCLRDRRFGFLFRPGGWDPDVNGATEKDLPTLLAQWMCSDRPVTVLDLSGVPSTVLDKLIGAVLRILFDALFWGRDLPVGGRSRPLLVVLEEAHRYLGRTGTEPESFSSREAALAARRIAREGRKYGVGLMLVSQRPSEIDHTILSQCGTMIALRLTNERDRGQVASVSSDHLKGLFSMLPILRTHEALVVGEAVNMPIRVRIDVPGAGRWPDSRDPMVAWPEGDDGEWRGGWTESPEDQDYVPLVAAWRSRQVGGEDSSADSSEDE